MKTGGISKALSYKGWAAVVAALVCQIFIMGAPISTTPLIYKHVIHEFHWTFSQATLGYSLGKWIGGGAAIFIVGPFLERLGLRILMIVAASFTGLGMIGFLAFHALWSYYLCFLPISLGSAAAMVGTKILISRWYTRNIGMATGIALAGGSLGGVFLPIAWTSMMARYGWRIAEASVGLSILVIALPVYLLLARENPTESEVAPEAQAGLGDARTAEILRRADLDVTFGKVLRSPMFWSACIGIMLIQAVDQGMLQHAALYLQNERGVTAKAAAVAISGMFAIGVLSKIAAGWFYDRTSIRGIQIWWLLMAVVVGLAFSVQAGTSLLIFSLAWGLAHGGLIGEGPVIAKHCFGPRLIDRVFPVFIGFLTLGSGLGAFVVSAMVDHFGGYKEAFALLIATALASAALLFLVRPVYRDRLRAALAGRDVATTLPDLDTKLAPT